LSALVEARLPFARRVGGGAGRNRDLHRSVFRSVADTLMLYVVGPPETLAVPPALPPTITSADAEARDGFAEHGREEDRRRVRGIGLGEGLIDRHGRRRAVVSDAVVGAGRRVLPVPAASAAAPAAIDAVTVPSALIPLTLTW
jgi:hypothetical protein